MRKDLIRMRTMDKNIVKILTSISNKQDTVDLFGYKVYTKSARYWNFSNHGFKCCQCGLEASYAAIEKKRKSKICHINIYGVKDGEEIMFTKDHIFPKSLGGKNTSKNYQVMCETCNQAKFNKLPDNLKYIVDNDLIDSAVVFGDIRIANKLAQEHNEYLDKFLEKEVNKYYE